MTRRARAWCLLVLACCILVGLILMLHQRQALNWLSSNDFVEYWSAGQLLRSGQNPYNLRALYAIEKSIG